MNNIKFSESKIEKVVSLLKEVHPDVEWYVDDDGKPHIKLDVENMGEDDALEALDQVREILLENFEKTD